MGEGSLVTPRLVKLLVAVSALRNTIVQLALGVDARRLLDLLAFVVLICHCLSVLIAVIELPLVLLIPVARRLLHNFMLVFHFLTGFGSK